MPSDRRCGTCRWWSACNTFCTWAPLGPLPDWWSCLTYPHMEMNDGVDCSAWEAHDADAE